MKKQRRRVRTLRTEKPDKEKGNKNNKKGHSAGSWFRRLDALSRAIAQPERVSLYKNSQCRIHMIVKLIHLQISYVSFQISSFRHDSDSPSCSNIFLAPTLRFRSNIDSAPAV